ncbi:MAG: CopD family protein [Gammaproteobacteria bacterium]|nr:CopD family protein [Gammaproteobacteria bacterium]MBU1722900.1 CopD family protein [Gammaproteobacteria bacterium]MBU2005723.1 CopD family protein [Gammaproteobacteria bacterium]
MSIALALHVLSVVIWVGGMFFAYMALRPAAAAVLEPSQRLSLWSSVFARFFPWVWASVLLILTSGYWMLFVKLGGMANAPLFVHAMNGLGLIMMAIFVYVYFVPYRHLHDYVLGMRWQEAGRSLAKIRVLIGVNLSIGLITVVVASAGKYFL